MEVSANKPAADSHLSKQKEMGGSPVCFMKFCFQLKLLYFEQICLTGTLLLQREVYTYPRFQAELQSGLIHSHVCQSAPRQANKEGYTIQNVWKAVFYEDT